LLVVVAILLLRRGRLLLWKGVGISKRCPEQVSHVFEA
jgi:hypothetical protein